MSQEMIEGTPHEITVQRDPQMVLAEARKAAQALMDVVSQKNNPVIMNGERYLEFEDWQTLGQFYGLSAKVTSTRYIELGTVHGYEAAADLIRVSDGMVISSAEAMCLNDEDKWSTRAKYDYVDGKRKKIGDVAVPLFQLRSMSQTRACAKAYRNKLAWVVVLAGFKPTPAEELTGDETSSPKMKPEVVMPKPKDDTIAPANPNGALISDAQSKRLYAIQKATGYPDEEFKQWLLFTHELDSTKQIPRKIYDSVIDHIQHYKAP